MCRQGNKAKSPTPASSSLVVGGLPKTLHKNIRLKSCMNKLLFRPLTFICRSVAGYAVYFLLFVCQANAQEGDIIIQRVLLSITGPQLLYNEALVAFIEGATEDFDNEYDAPKIHATNLSLYTSIPGRDLAIQARPLLRYDHTIQLGINASESGSRTLHLNYIDNIPESSFIVLEDELTQEMINLRNQESYTFNLNHLTDTFRFKLHVGAYLDFQLYQETCQLNDGSIEFNNQSDYPWSGTVTNPFGQVIWQSDSVLGISPVNDLYGGVYTFSGINAFGDVLNIFLQVDAGQPFQMIAEADVEFILPGTEVLFSSAGQTPDSLIWLIDANEIISIEAEFGYTFENPGVYLIRFIAWRNGCEFSKDLIITVADENVTSTSDLRDLSTGVYPNPATDFINSSLPDGSLVQFITIQGQNLGNFTSNNGNLSIERLPKGTYKMIYNVNELQVVKTLIKQ